MSKTTKSVPEQEATPWLYYLSLPFRVITWPFYLVYWFLFRVLEVPNPLVGVIRLAIFVAIALEYRAIDMFIIDTVSAYELPKWCASLPMGIISILMLIGLFLSFMGIMNLYDASKSGLVFSMDESEPTGSSSGYSGIDDALEFRETILNSQHIPGQIEELKKTRFVSAADISSASKSPQLARSLEFMNTRMNAQHALGKYNLLKEMFGGK